MLHFTAVIDGLPVCVNPHQVVFVRAARGDDSTGGVPIHAGTLIITTSERETVQEALDTVVNALSPYMTRGISGV